MYFQDWIRSGPWHEPNTGESLKAIITIALLFLSAAASALEGRVVGVTDGDTIKVLDGWFVEHKIRLQCIDAPEKSMAFEQRAKQALASLVAGKNVSVKVLDTDRYGREVGEVSVDGQSANLGMVRMGFAWAYPKYCHDKNFYEAQDEARSGRSGLWVDANPTPPWEYRKAMR